MSKHNGNGRSVNVVAYLRRSTDKQEASIPDQRSAVTRYADEHGFKIIREYVDDAISGDDTTKRLAFLSMIADAKDKGDFGAILCWDQDRFGRFDSQEAGYWTFQLRKADVTLVTVNDGPIDWNDFTGRVMYGLKQEGKHQFLRDLSRNVARGQLEAANNGSWLGSVPYAYRIEGERKHKGLVLDDPSKVLIVKRVFREYVKDGRSMTNIADRLNAEKIPSPGELAPWRFDSVKTILENPAYVGDYASCRYAYGKYHSIKDGRIVASTGRCRRPEAEWIVHPDHHEAIIDRATFAKAKAILAKGKTGRSPHTPETNPYIFFGLLRCGRCGSPMWGMTANKKNKYYRCANQQYNGDDACEGCNVREDRLLHTIADHLRQEFLSLDGDALALKAERNELKPGDLPKAFAKVKELVSPSKQLVHDRKRTEKQAKAVAAKIDKARRNLVFLDPENIATAQEEIRRLQDERGQLELELRKRLPSEADVNAEAISVLRNLWWLGVYFRKAATPPEAYEKYGVEEFNLLTCDDWSPLLKPYLRNISAITVHTRKEGQGTGSRHHLERGEITFRNGSCDEGVEPSPPD